MKKRFSSGLVIGVVVGVVLAISGVAVAEQYYKVEPNVFPIIVNGQRQDIDALNINDRTYLQLRGVGAVLNTNVDFNENNQIIIGDPPPVAPKPDDENKPDFYYLSDGVKAERLLDGFYYVFTNNIEKHMENDLGLKFYSFFDTDGNGTLDLDDGQKAILLDVPSSTQSRYMIPVEYYENIIRPLIEQKAAEL